MALHEEAIVEHSGVDKEVDSGALAMLLDNVQISQYSYPVKSTIRELVSNGVDSINEKKTARAILTGQADVGNFYYVPGKNPDLDEAIAANPGVYKDSQFDPSYYDLTHLSDNDNVEITYYQKDETKDRMVIRDNGVGLGDQRLYGYLRIGYSTKRLSLKPLGKFGIGAKSPLSLNVPYFEVVSVHNGRKFHFMIYSGHFESAIPAFDERGKNESIQFYKEDGTPVLDKNTGLPKQFYWTATTEQNYTEVQVDCKKSFVDQVRTAVQSQLLYFDNVTYTIVSPSGARQDIPVLATKLFEDDSIVISENNQFSKPHIVINNVNYGYVDTEMLELEEMRGNIGIKIGSGMIDVTPNRENVIWNDKVNKVMLAAVQNAQEAARKVISNSFKQTDFMQWLQSCAGVLGIGEDVSGSTDNLKALKQLQFLAKVRRDVHPEFLPDPSIKYSPIVELMFPGLKARLVKKVQIKRKKGLIEEVQRTEVFLISTLMDYPTYIQNGKSSKKRDEYMLSDLHPSGFIVLRVDKKYIKDVSVSTVDDDDEAEDVAQDTTQSESEYFKRLKAERNMWELDGDKTIPLLLPYYTNYEDVAVKTPTQQLKEIELSPEEIRRREGRVIVQTPRSDGAWHKAQPKVGDLYTIDKEFYWGNQSNEVYGPENEHGDIIKIYDDRDLLRIAMQVIKPAQLVDRNLPEVKAHFEKMGLPGNDYYGQFATAWSDPAAKVLLGLVNKDNMKYVQEDHFHITEFFNRFEGGTLTMAASLIQWNTARLLKEKLKNLEFMQGMYKFNQEMYDKWEQLNNYVNEYYTSLNGNALVDAVVFHLDRVYQLQEFVRNNPDDADGLKEIVTALFAGSENLDQITGGKAVDIELLDLADEVVDWIQPMKPMMILLDGTLANIYNVSQLSQEEEEAIREYIDWKTR